jgi:microcystin-dependent protein
MMYAGPSAPAGWLFCDGSYYSIGTYNNLYNVIGPTFGGTAGTFAVPDLRDRFPLGLGINYGISLGQLGGEQTHTLTANEMPTHNHALTNNTGTSVMSYGTTTPGYDVASFMAGNGGNTVPQISTETAGLGAAHNNMPPYIVLNFIIKT